MQSNTSKHTLTKKMQSNTFKVHIAQKYASEYFKVNIAQTYAIEYFKVHIDTRFHLKLTQHVIAIPLTQIWILGLCTMRASLVE